MYHSGGRAGNDPLKPDKESIKPPSLCSHLLFKHKKIGDFNADFFVERILKNIL